MLLLHSQEVALNALLQRALPLQQLDAPRIFPLHARAWLVLRLRSRPLQVLFSVSSCIDGFHALVLLGLRRRWLESASYLAARCRDFLFSLLWLIIVRCFG